MTVGSLEIEVLETADCGNCSAVIGLVKDVLEELEIVAEVVRVEVLDQVSAERLRFLGSPTVRVNGMDVEPQAADCTNYGLG